MLITCWRSHLLLWVLQETKNESLSSDAEGEEVVDDIKEEDKEEKSDTTQRDSIGRDDEEIFSYGLMNSEETKVVALL